MYEKSVAIEGAGEKRRTPRSRTLKQGRIILADSSTLSCVVRDISRSGARLVLGTLFHLPPRFDIAIAPGDSVDGVELIWQRGLAAGVAFRRG